MISRVVYTQLSLPSHFSRQKWVGQILDSKCPDFKTAAGSRAIGGVVPPLKFTSRHTATSIWTRCSSKTADSPSRRLAPKSLTPVLRQWSLQLCQKMMTRFKLVSTSSSRFNFSHIECTLWLIVWFQDEQKRRTATDDVLSGLDFSKRLKNPDMFPQDKPFFCDKCYRGYNTKHMFDQHVASHVKVW